MGNQPNMLIVNFSDINNITNLLENPNGFPTIDIDALLSVVIEMFMLNSNLDTDRAVDYLLKSEIVSGRYELEGEDYFRLDSLLSMLVSSVKNKINELGLYEAHQAAYEYHSRRKNDVVLLRKCKQYTYA